MLNYAPAPARGQFYVYYLSASGILCYKVYPYPPDNLPVRCRNPNRADVRTALDWIDADMAARGLALARLPGKDWGVDLLEGKDD